MDTMTAAHLEEVFDIHDPEQHQAVATILAQTAEEVLVSRTRAVFMFERHVMKLPLNDAGVHANADEAALHQASGKRGYVPIAECEIVWLDDRVSALMMERVMPVATKKGLPEWTTFVDCQQVGHDRDGQLVAYDL